MQRTIVYTALALFSLNAFIGSSVSKAAVAENRKSLTIRRVKLDTKMFDPSNGQTVTLSFELSKEANVKVIIYNILGQEIQCFDLPAVEPGRHDVKWDGLRSDGKRAAGNIFLYVIEATDGQNKTVYNPAKETGGVLVKSHEFTFDKKTGKLKYVLPKSCMVRLRAGLNNGMLARTILDWQPQTAGRHTYKWDGKDESRLMNLLGHPELNLNLTCYTLPANTIIATGEMVQFEPKANPIKITGKEKDDLWAREGKYLHYTHDPRNCHEPKFVVSFPNQSRVNEEGIPVVSGTAKIRTEIDERDAQHLMNKRFEIMLYIDGTYIFEMEEGSSPFTFDFNTDGVGKGPHVLTVNVMSYDGHIGTVNHRLIIGE